MKLYKNATFYSMNDKGEIYNQILTNDGLIIACGDDCNLFEANEVIDLNNMFVYPGFIDAHIHLIGLGRKLSSINISELRNKDDVVNRIHSIFDNENLRIEGYFDCGITKDDLDFVSNKNIIILRHNDYHSFTVNSYVLNQVEINSETGIITSKKECDKILPLWSKASKNDLENYTLAAIKTLYKYGITNVHTDDLAYFNSYDETIGVLNDVTRNYPMYINTLINYEIFKDYFKYFPQNKYLQKIQVKFFYDGTLSSKTALLKQNYQNETTNGTRIISKNELEEIVKIVRRKKMGLAIHVIGDLALTEVVEVLEKYQEDKIIDRIVHASLADIETIKRICKLNISIDIQPLFVKSDEQLIKKVISHEPLVYPFAKYIKNGIIVNSSSDAPVEDPNPLFSIYELNTIDRVEAIKMYTVNPGITINDNSGIIKKGYKANFTVFSKDIMILDRKEL